MLVLAEDRCVKQLGGGDYNTVMDLDYPSNFLGSLYDFKIKIGHLIVTTLLNPPNDPLKVKG